MTSKEMRAEGRFSSFDSTVGWLLRKFENLKMCKFENGRVLDQAVRGVETQCIASLRN